ncbi:glycine--tRNA ligase subunit beta [Sphingoaurantiacus capsulatus]|uniref:Glycine--tRNA ligase beta subunit n=1 Tax=Sphingoaurantiacus capsulatus TaxID=1771310 RepID=A0ABV7X664_9SPHN
MADFLLELFSEEIPARMQPKAADDLKRLFGEALAAAGLKASAIETHATPRRLALIATGLPLATADQQEERRGPKADAPAQAIDGFLKSTGLSRDQLEERDDPKGRFLYAMISKAGRPTRDVLAEAVPSIVRAFPWPKSMRWGSGTLRWVRPLHSIIALLDGDLVDLDIDGIRSGRTTTGHRFLSRGTIEIASAADYAATLRAAHVILSADERAKLIGDGARAQATAKGLELIEDAGLLAENAGLTEWPVPLIGDFDPSFLDVPPEVIQLTMRVNQKYFACRDPKTGALAPAFVCVANIEASDGGAAIVAGNRKVLAARLSDAKFFWEQDKKQALETYLAKLDGMLFYEGMGSLREKTERLSRLSSEIARRYFPERDPATAERAGLLAKADLGTGMVGEFPELQGIMGGYYAEQGGEKPGVVAALKQQYLPVAEGCIPACVAIADRVDTLAAFFARGIKPTGSKDPFALRRAALGIIQTITHNQIRMPLLPVLMFADRLISRGGDKSLIEDMAQEAFYKRQGTDSTAFLNGHGFALLDFFADRLKVQQREAGVRHDLIDAVFALGGEDDLVRLLARVKALQAFVATEDGTNLLAGYKRAANILRIEEKKDGASFDGDVEAKLLTAAEEQRLAAELDAVIPDARAAVEREDFTAAMASLARLRAPIDAFFTDVTVNDSNADVRANRLRLLGRIRAAVHTVADFSRIES